ncbi:MAG: hypothetical protein ACR2G6_03290 [Gemmatimonadaceae bacterium]
MACSSLPIIGRAKREVWSFAAPWDARSIASAKAHGGSLDGIVSGWITLDSLTGEPRPQLPDSLFASMSSGTKKLMLVTSFAGQRFHPATIRGLASAPAQLTRVANDIGRRASVGGYAGIVLDFEQHVPADLPALIVVARAIREAAHARDIRPVVLAIPPGDTAAYPGGPLASAVDMLMVMLYDEHWASSSPGPIASPEWVRRHLGLRVGEVGAGRLVAGLPLYGYLWRRDSTGRSSPAPSNSTPALAGYSGETMSFNETQNFVSAAGLSLERDPSSGSLRAARPLMWEVWVTDAELLRALVEEAEGAGVRRIALWRLGLEDPRIWGVGDGGWRVGRK